MKRWIYFLPLAVFASLVFFFARGLMLDPGALPSALIGKPAPAFALARVDDAGINVSRDDFKGRVWLLNVWASWCAACRDEHAELMAFARTGRVPIVGLDYKDTRGAAQAWLSQFGNPYAVTLFDERGQVGIDYGVYGVPETFVIDQQGIVRARFAGALTREIIATKIDPLLKALGV